MIEFDTDHCFLNDAQCVIDYHNFRLMIPCHKILIMPDEHVYMKVIYLLFHLILIRFALYPLPSHTRSCSLGLTTTP